LMTLPFGYVGSACADLIARGFVDEAVVRALEQVGHGARVDRVYIFERIDGADDRRKLCSQRYEWSADRVEAQIDNAELQNVDMDELAPTWVEAFARDEHVAGLVKTMPEPTREMLVAQQVQSICVCPIVVGRDWWGFVGFDDCHSERVWPDDEVRALRRLSMALAASLRRAQTRARLEDARRQLQALAAENPSEGGGSSLTPPKGRSHQS
jgi:GAF domain-containing protein